MSPERSHHSHVLYRTKYGRVAGICAGLAKHFNVPVHTIRSAFLLLMVMTLGIAGVVYLVLWQILPVKDDTCELVDVVPFTAHSMRYHVAESSTQHSAHVSSTYTSTHSSSHSTNGSPSTSQVASHTSHTLHASSHTTLPAHHSASASKHYSEHASFHASTPSHRHPFMPPQATKMPFERLKEKWRYWLQDDLRSVPFIARIALSVGLFVMFTFIVLSGRFLFPHSQWWYFWPLFFMALGMICIVAPVNDFYYCVALHIAGVGVTLFSGALLPCCLGVLSWLTWLNAIMYLWPFIAVALSLYFVGVLRNSVLLMLVSLGIFAICVAVVLFVLYVPGSVQTVCLHGLGASDLCLFTPDGKWIF